MIQLTGEGRIDLKEALRYLGYNKAADFSDINGEIEECKKLLYPSLSPKACLELFDIKRGEALDLGFYRTDSKSLALNLEGCSKIVLFAATVGAETDRLILRYAKISPARSLILQAMGSSAVECWCDDVCEIIKNKFGDCKPRFSCGYGDLPLSMQRDVFAALDITKRLGITLNENLFMTPTKSVTAIVGIKD